MASKDTRFHIALDVVDLARSAAFYRALFGREPAKLRPDYAKFELDDPPLVFSLNQTSGPLPAGRLSHLGLRLSSNAALDAARTRLLAAGLQVRDEPQAHCCYALQDKIWLEDPDGTAWEIYVLHADRDTHSAKQHADPTACCVKP